MIRGKRVEHGVSRFGAQHRRFGLVERFDRRREPHAEEMTEHDLRAERVDRGDARVRDCRRLLAEIRRLPARRALSRVGQALCDTGLHFARRGARKGQHKHMLDPDALGDEPVDALGEYGRLARARRRGNDQVAAFFDRGDLCLGKAHSSSPPFLRRSSSFSFGTPRLLQPSCGSKRHTAPKGHHTLCCV